MTRDDLIFDVGANNGDDSAYYLARGFHVLAVEADPVLAIRLRQRFSAELSAGTFQLLNVGVARETSEAEFWICETHSEWNSFDQTIASREGQPHHAVVIPCRTFASILEEFGVPHYLKIDIEGNDRMCLEALDPRNLPRFCSVEVAMPTLETMTLLRRLGYEKFKLIEQSDFTELNWIPNESSVVRAGMLHLVRPAGAIGALAVRAVFRAFFRPKPSSPIEADGWTFPKGSSGPFGKDLPGPWRSMDDIAFSWLAYWLGYTPKKPGLGYWHDVHCERD
jgi:FkbM family methyltransferase